MISKELKGYLKNVIKTKKSSYEHVYVSAETWDFQNFGISFADFCEEAVQCGFELVKDEDKTGYRMKYHLTYKDAFEILGIE